MPNESEIDDHIAREPAGSMRYSMRAPIALGIAALVALAAYTASSVSSRSQANRPRQARSSFTLDLTGQFHIDPKLLHYEQQTEIPITLSDARAVATADDGHILVAGDRAIHVLSAAGERLHIIELADAPLCIAVDDSAPDDSAPDSRSLYVATSQGIRVFDSHYEEVDSWQLPQDDSLVTSIAVADGLVFAADAANRIVWRFDTSGKLQGQIGAPDPARNISGFVVPSAHFDIAASPEGLLYCVDPGRQQIAAFTFDGDFGASWGKAGSSVSDFFGCCNPAHIALIDDGRFVTSEKGIPRIKVYDSTGHFESVVAGPEQLGISTSSMGDPRLATNSLVFDIAVDVDRRVLVLDGRHQCVRVFVKTGT